ncbi:unnamed protein product [Brugia timori]|uniref:DUF2575 domain-containing protein n=1 Tax=Brugia timori TaxID=42155 RepID=A0A0R3QC57_9BILA|nr:unnamed protein product [Brugia timori]
MKRVQQVSLSSHPVYLLHKRFRYRITERSHHFIYCREWFGLRPEA